MGDLEFNASYIVIHYGRLIVGTADDPFLNNAIITIRGERTAYELPVYGAKVDVDVTEQTKDFLS